jgi:hypothetical protein
VPAKSQETRRKSRIDLDLYCVYGISEGLSAFTVRTERRESFIGMKD